MTVITIKGRDYLPVVVKDSFDRRALQFANAIVTKLYKLGLNENDIDLTVERVAFRKIPAAVTWYMDGHRLYYSCAVRNSYAENLALVSKVVDAEVQAVLDGEVPIEDFIRKFIEDEGVEDERRKARETLGVDATEKDAAVIDKAYKELAKEHHPDKHGGDDTEFKKINNAHKTLKRELT
jgi:hypothetical protein